MADATAPLYGIADRYLDAVEKGQTRALDVAAKASGRVHQLWSDRLHDSLVRRAPKAYPRVSRALDLQQTFTRELVRIWTGA